MRFSFENAIEDVTYTPMVLYWYLGLHPGCKSRLFLLYKYFNMLVVLCFGYFVVMEIKIGLAGSFTAFLENLQIWSSFFSCSVKYFALSYRCYVLADILKESQYFWSVSEFGNREHFELLRKVKVFIRFYLATGLSLFVIHTVEALYFGIDFIPFYRPEGFNTGLNIARFWILYILGITTDAFNMGFIGICAELYVQIKLLTLQIEMLDDDPEHIPIKLKGLVAHHSFLLKFFEKINTYCKDIFVSEFGFFMLGFCLEVFILSQDSIVQEFGFLEIIKVAVYFLFQVLQLMSYVLPGNFLVDAFSQISEVIYNKCEWHTYPVTLQKELGVVIAVAQQKVRLNGYGLVVYNLETTKEIYKYVMTFYTALKVMNEKIQI